MVRTRPQHEGAERVAGFTTHEMLLPAVAGPDSVTHTEAREELAMASPTIVDEYIDAAMKLASIERLDGVFASTVPEAFGIIAFGATEEDCAKDLRLRLEDWVAASLSEGESLPVFDGIDLNCPEAQTLTRYHSLPQPAADGTFFENDREFLSALTRWEREDKPLGYGSS